MKTSEGAVTSSTVHADERGFTIVEMMVAISILAIALISIAYTSSIGFTYSARARQKQDAASAANQAVEQIKALAFANLESGMKTSDLAGDSAITTCGTDKCFGGEVIVQTANPPTSPLNPHVATLTVGPTQYTRKAYLTYVSGSGSTKVKITVKVSWQDDPSAGTKTSTITSVVPLTTACPAGDLHPYAGPCQTEVTARAEAPSITIQIDPIDTNGDGDANDAGEGFPVSGWQGSNPVLMFSPDVGAALDSEQTVDVTASTTTGGFTVTNQARCGEVLSAVEAATTGVSYAAAPSAANDTTCASSVSTPPQIQVPAGFISNGFILQKTAAATPATGSAVATTAASGADAVSCNSQTDGTPCGYAQMRSGGTSYALWSAAGYSSTSLGTADTCPLVQVTPPGTNSSAYVKRPAASGSTDKATATVARYLPTVTIGCVPTAFTSALWSGRTAWDAQAAVPAASQRRDSTNTLRGFWLQLTGFTQQASVESGTGTTASTPSRTGTIYYWNGSSYSSASVPAYNASATIPSSGGLPNPAVDTGCVSIGTGKNKVVLSPIDPGTVLGGVAAQTNFSMAAMNSTSAGSVPVTSASKTFSAPVFPTLRVQVFGANVNCNPQLADFAITIDYGETGVSSTYSVPTP